MVVRNDAPRPEGRQELFAAEGQAEDELGVTRHVPRSSLGAGSGGGRDARGVRVEIEAHARSLGFAKIGYLSVSALGAGLGEASARLAAWLERGFHGEMAYLADGERGDPKRVLPTARALIVGAVPYRLTRSEPPAAGRGSVAGYAAGGDYHRVIKQKLRQLADHCADVVSRPLSARACVDTAPLLERELAVRAGLGFIGKSGMLILPGVGSNVLLGELLLDTELPVESPAPWIDSGCGSCTACLDACPTAAFPEAYVLDARRCISYLTIEHRGSVPGELRAALGTRVFGCDVCQNVCPYNASSKPRADVAELGAAPERSFPDLVRLLGAGVTKHKKYVKQSALRRVSRERLARNAAIALGNTDHADALPALAHALANDRSALVRSHAAWALGRLGSDSARLRTAAQRALLGAASDPHTEVRNEVARALTLFQTLQSGVTPPTSATGHGT